MRRWIRRAPWIVLGLGILGAIVYAFQPQPVPVEMAPAVVGPLQVTVDEDGKTRIKERYIVSAPLSGLLLRVDLEAGDPVVAGSTALATIEPADPELLDERELAQAEARVKAAEAAVLRAETALQAAQAAAQLAESEYARIGQLFERNAATRDDLERAELQYETRVEERKAAQFTLEIAKFEAQQARAALLRSYPESEADVAKWNFQIRSPITGQVLRVFQESMTVVTPGTSLMELGDTRDLELVVDVLSTDAVKIHPGDRVIVEHWGGERPLEAVVRLVEPSAFTKISALGVEEQRVNVIANLINPFEERETLGDGFRIEARIVIWEDSDVLKVPTSALFRRGDDWAVYVVQDGQAQIRTVEIGHRSGLESEVLDGLRPGEIVVLHPSDRIQDGAEIVESDIE